MVNHSLIVNRTLWAAIKQIEHIRASSSSTTLWPCSKRIYHDKPAKRSATPLFWSGQAAHCNPIIVGEGCPHLHRLFQQPSSLPLQRPVKARTGRSDHEGVGPLTIGFGIADVSIQNAAMADYLVLRYMQPPIRVSSVSAKQESRGISLVVSTSPSNWARRYPGRSGIRLDVCSNAVCVAECPHKKVVFVAACQWSAAFEFENCLPSYNSRSCLLQFSTERDRKKCCWWTLFWIEVHLNTLIRHLIKKDTGFFTGRTIGSDPFYQMLQLTG